MTWSTSISAGAKTPAVEQVRAKSQNHGGPIPNEIAEALVLILQGHGAEDRAVSISVSGHTTPPTTEGGTSGEHIAVTMYV
jgi:hypothetical protein